jgi:sulfite oxidase
MKAVKAVRGLDWDGGAIGTAVWSGVRLKDVLEYAGGWCG